MKSVWLNRLISSHIEVVSTATPRIVRNGRGWREAASMFLLKYYRRWPAWAARVAEMVETTARLLHHGGTRSRITGKFVRGARSGVDPVEDFIAQAEENGFEVVGREISFKTPFETRRVDVVLRNRATGQVGGFEIKSSRAEFNKRKKEQFAADRFINRQGATAVGKNAERAGVERIDSVMKILWEP